MLAFLLAVASDTAAAVQLIVPIDVVALVQALFTGIAALGGVFATIYAIMAKVRADKIALAQVEFNLRLLKVSNNLDLVERNTNSMTSTIKELATKAGIVEGQAKEKIVGAETAATLAAGRQLGRDEERGSVAAAGKVTTITAAGAAPMADTGKPIPVQDDAVAVITKAATEVSKEIAEATKESAKAAAEINKRVAEATERSADAQQQIADTAKDKK